jgi:hypothetical protein
LPFNRNCTAVMRLAYLVSSRRTQTATADTPCKLHTSS